MHIYRNKAAGLLSRGRRKTKCGLNASSDEALPGDKIGTAGDLNAGRLLAVQERVEVSKDECIERGRISGRREYENSVRNVTHSEPRNHLSVARRSERAAIASE